MSVLLMVYMFYIFYITVVALELNQVTNLHNLGFTDFYPHDAVSTLVAAGGVNILIAMKVELQTRILGYSGSQIAFSPWKPLIAGY